MENLKVVCSGKTYKIGTLILYKKVTDYGAYFLTDNKDLTISIYAEECANTHYSYTEAKEIAQILYNTLDEYPTIIIIDRTQEGKYSRSTLSNLTYVDRNGSIMLYYSVNNGDYTEKYFLVLYAGDNRVGYTLVGNKIS